MPEGFRPVSNTPPTSLLGILKFYGRMILDLQALTVYRDIRKVLPSFRGRVLDVGCGQSPYRFLLNQKQTEYFGLDIADAFKFDYQNSEITAFNGEDVPFESEKFDALICTEVLEHAKNYSKLVNEMCRVLKPGGRAIVTVPWSARYHYIPHDYFRYTPSSLKEMFAGFNEVEIRPRGSDVASIANKIVVMWSRNLLPTRPVSWLLVPLWIMLSPIAATSVIIAHLSLIFGFGSSDDPLGYTIYLKK